MSKYTVPSREALINGLARVALDGRQQEIILACRHRGLNWLEDKGFMECRRIINALYSLAPDDYIVVEDDGILDLLAHTQQMARVSNEEWSEIVRVGKLENAAEFHRRKK